jgi:oligosaccharide repeat unit polymerase
MKLLNPILIIFCIYLLQRRNLFFTQIFFFLVVSFNYLPTFVSIFFDDLTFAASGEDAVIDIKMVLFVVAFYFGSLSNDKVLETSDSKAMSRLSLQIALIINICFAIIIVGNNLFVSSIVMSSGYLSAYQEESTSILFKNITILPLYLYTSFLLICMESPLHFQKIDFSKSVKIGVFFVLASYFFTGGRSTSIYLLLILGSIISHKMHISFFKKVIYAFGGVGIAVAFGFLRESEVSYSGVRDVFLRPIVELSNTVSIFSNSDNILTIDNIRYVSGLLYLLPQTFVSWLGLIPPSLLSMDYVNAYDPGWAQVGGGFGFSILAELYLIFGFTSLIIGSYVLGFVCSWIDITLRSRNYNKFAAAASIGFFMLFLVRGELIELYRHFFIITITYIVFIYINLPSQILKSRSK